MADHLLDPGTRAEPYESRRPPILDEDLDNADVARSAADALDILAWVMSGTITGKRPSGNINTILRHLSLASTRRRGGSRLTTDDLSAALDAAAEALRAAAGEVERRVDGGEG